MEPMHVKNLDPEKRLGCYGKKSPFSLSGNDIGCKRIIFKYDIYLQTLGTWKEELLVEGF